ncbi:hypothetical protein TNCV_1611231 [Trichonephila clavipes]|nr:hypothetical protein TNCV_1611231 [Trichonephila clavipes]
MNWITHMIRMPDDNVVQKELQFKVTGIRKHVRSRLRWEDSLWDYKQENLENKSKKRVIMEESSNEGTGPRGAV